MLVRMVIGTCYIPSVPHGCPLTYRVALVILVVMVMVSISIYHFRKGGKLIRIDDCRVVIRQHGVGIIPFMPVAFLSALIIRIPAVVCMSYHIYV